MNRKSTRPRRPLGLSAALGVTCLAAVAATALAADGDTERVSVGRGGAEGDGAAELASISADGRFVAFDLAAANLVADNMNDLVDVFVHDRLRGRTERVSVSSDGDEAVLPASAPSISAGGRFLAFPSPGHEPGGRRRERRQRRLRPRPARVRGEALSLS